MEILVYQPNAVHIIHTCLQGFHGTTAEEETFENLFGQGSAIGPEALLEYEAMKEMGGEKSQLPLSDPHHENLKRDFLNAHALQYFVNHNPKLRRPLLPHHVELYIRVKNSSRRLGPLKGGDTGADSSSPATTQHIGTSIKCPIQTPRDAEALSSGKFSFMTRSLKIQLMVCRIELRYQFLKHANWLLDTNRRDDLDLRGVDCVLKAVEKSLTSSGVDVDEPPLEERLKSVLKMVDNHFRNQSYPGRHPRRESTDGTIAVYDSRGVIDSPLDREQGDQDPRSPGAFKDPDDKELSSAILSSLLMPLYNSVRSKLQTIKPGQLKRSDERVKNKKVSDYLPV
jgi:hypothetical protein